MLIMAQQMLPMIITIFIIFIGVNITLPIALNRALIGFEDVMGMASGLLSFVYYLLISALTFLMSIMHNGSVFSLPQYLIIIILMIISGQLAVQWLTKNTE